MLAVDSVCLLFTGIQVSTDTTNVNRQVTNLKCCSLNGTTWTDALGKPGCHPQQLHIMVSSNSSAESFFVISLFRYCIFSRRALLIRNLLNSSVFKQDLKSSISQNQEVDHELTVCDSRVSSKRTFCQKQTKTLW